MPPLKRLQDLLFVDVETTGLDDSRHELLEVAAIRTSSDGLTVISTYEAKIKPLHIEAAEPKALQTNGYTPEEWTDDKCVPREVIAGELTKMAQNTVLVGQNVSFDEGFLTAFFKELGVKPPWGYHKIDTVSLAWPYFLNTSLEGLSLGKLCTYLGVTTAPTHRASADVAACRAVYLKLMTQWNGTFSTPTK